MKSKKRWLAALLLLLVLFLPLLVNLDVFRRQVHDGLVGQLGLRVEVESLAGRLLPRPGLVASKVKVFQPEGFGAEPLVYAQELRCDLALSVLWTGVWSCAAVHLDRASINVMRNRQGEWNLAALLAGSVLEGQGMARPALSVANSRINLKLGYDKATHSLRKATLYMPPLEGGGWRLRLEATPARSDRRLPETGTLQVDAEFRTAGELADLPVRLRARLEQGSFAQLFELVTGDESPVRAEFSLQAQMQGTPVAFEGRLGWTLAELRQQDLLPRAGSPLWQGQFNLQLADHGRMLRIKRATLQARETRIEGRGRIADPFGQRRWRFEVTQGRVALEEFLQQWSAVKAGVPPTTRVAGLANLRLEADGDFADWQGELVAPEAINLRAAGLAEPVAVAGLRLRLQDGRVVLDPLRLRFSPEEELVVDARLHLQEEGWPFRLRWQSERVGLEPLQQAAAALGWKLWRRSQWRGRVRVDLTWQGRMAELEVPVWRGQATVEEATFYPPELNEPLEVPEAELRWTNEGLQVAPLVARLAGNPVTGELARSQEGVWRVELATGRVDIEFLDRLLNPARRGLLVRLVGPERGASRWNRFEATGEVRVEEVVAGPFRFHRVRAGGSWQEGGLRLSRLRFRTYQGRFDGSLQGDFTRKPPHFRLAGNLKGAALGEVLAATTGLGDLYRGSLGVDLSFQSAGLRPRQLLGALQGRVVGVVQDGAIRHVDLLSSMAAAREETQPVSVDGATEMESLAGEFLVADRQVELDGVRMIVDGAALELTGRVRFDGSLDLLMTGGPLQVAGRRASARASDVAGLTYQVRGTLRAPLVELREPPPAAASAR